MSVAGTGLTELVAAVQTVIDDLTARRDALQHLHGEAQLKHGEWSGRNMDNPDATWPTPLQNLTTQKEEFQADLIFQSQELIALNQVKANLEAIVQRRQTRFAQRFLVA